MSRIDDRFETWARALARRTSRRSFFGRVAGFVAGASALPLLPIARAAAAEPDAGRRAGAPAEDIAGDAGDPTKCDYWRNCAIDGFLCACCGGSTTACPPGTEMSPVTWIGTCTNPGDGKDYVISYNDCCGKGFCGRCGCNRNEGDRPEYHWYRSNDINWCAGARSQAYHCSVAIVVGQATEAQPEQ